MDVPAAAGSTATLPPPIPVSPATSDGTIQAPPSAPPPANVTALNTTTTTAQQPDSSIAPVVAKVFNTDSQNVVVSFKVVRDLNEVVTVFTDKTTGKEIVQFPSQELIALAEFFSKLAGSVLDKTA